MSEIGELIHTSTMRAHRQGEARERERIIALLWDWGIENLDCQTQYEDLVALINRGKE
jgi:hypothetical protein